jgi:hypothetical protein
VPLSDSGAELAITHYGAKLAKDSLRLVDRLEPHK